MKSTQSGPSTLGIRGLGWKGIAEEAAIGASSNVAATLTAGKYYQYDQDHQVDTKSLLITGG